MKVQEKKKVRRTITDEVVKQIFCDVCEKEIEKGERYYAAYSFQTMFTIKSFNETWQEYQLCSMTCLQKSIANYYSEPERSMEYKMEHKKFDTVYG